MRESPAPRALSGAWLEPSAATSLAVFRITVGLTVATAQDVWMAARWAELPPALQVPPLGLGPLVAQLPRSPASMQLATAVLVASALSGALGFFSRTSFAVAATVGLYVLGVPQLSGSVVHDHHLVWFMALLAASPCGDALSGDRWWAARRGHPPPAPSVAYTLPVRIAWLLLGCVFFFPGFWKLRAGGLEWIWSDNLLHQLQWKWAQGGWLPALRIDRYPLLCRIAAAAVVAFELSFPFAVHLARLRPVAVASALLFHLATSLWMGFSFSILWCCYTVFVDWDAVARRLATAAPALHAWWLGGFAPRAPLQPPRPRRAWPALAAGALLVGPAVLTGFAGEVNAWPFACYPTFHTIPSERMPVLALSLVRKDGSSVELPQQLLLGDDERPRHWGLVWSLLRRPSPQRLRAYWRRIAGRGEVAPLLDEAQTVRFYEASLSVAPEEQSRPPLRGRLLYEWALTAAGD